MASTASARTPFEFFGETLSVAGGNKFTAEKAKHELDEIFAAAQGDPTIELVVMLRKGDDIALMGMVRGQLVQGEALIPTVLRPIVLGI